MKRQLIAEEWDKIARAGLANGASPTQIRQDRIVFYSGVQAMLALVAEHGHDFAAMAGIFAEIEEFTQLIEAMAAIEANAAAGGVK